MKTVVPEAVVFEPSGFFAFRTALLPFDVLLEWADGMSATAALTDEKLDSAIDRDRKELRSRLAALVAQPEIHEALFVASPSTCLELMRWFDKPDTEDVRLEQTLVRYLQRMAGRATPFGLFAGCSVGHVSTTTNLVLAARSEYRRHSRLDNDYLYALTQELQRKPEVRNSVKYRPNSSLYRLAGRWRYVCTELAGRRRRHCLVALDADEYLEATVGRAHEGASIDELVGHILTTDPDGDITREEASAYVVELVERQVLVTELMPIVTGPDALDDLINQVRIIQSLDAVVATLEETRSQLADLNRARLGVATQKYEDIRRTIDRLGVKADPALLFQVDLAKPAPAATCSVAVLDEIVRAITTLHRMTPPVAIDSLRRFKEAFTARYERQEMPLFEVLDEESGIGFDRLNAAAAEKVPLLEGIPLGGGDGPAIPWTGRDAFLLTKLETLARERTDVLTLTTSDLDRLAAAHTGTLPDSLGVMAVVSASADMPDADFQVFIRNIFGPSGATLLGRFCHADAELRDHVLKHIGAEQSLRREAIFAEVVHLPEGRMGNILARPVLREFEITYLGRSGAPLDRQIPISDLRVSVLEDRIVLRSARLGVEVIPRMTTAHNYSRGQAIYRFLCSLQVQAVTPRLGWGWGALEAASFLPRVVHGRVVLARARWRVGKELIARLTTTTFLEAFKTLRRWRQEHRPPRFVALVEGDNELPVDLDNVLSVETLLRLVRNREHVNLVEMFPGPEGLCARGPEGRFVHELLIPVVKTVPAPARPPQSRPTLTASARRSFPPGSEWLYLKWYAGTSSVDSLLRDVVPEFIRRHVVSGAVRRWFFVRYSDPEWHLRLRLEGNPTRLLSEVLVDAAAASRAPLHDRMLWKVQLDTYEREIERYGGDAGILPSESLFWRDSESAIEILQLLPGDEGAEARWRMCLLSWDLLLSDLGLTIEEKRALTKDARAALARQNRASKAVDRALGDRFRLVRKSLEPLLDHGRALGQPFEGALQLLGRRSAALKPIVGEMRELERAGQLSPIRALATSYLHMSANRLLPSSHLGQEFVLYDFLDWLDESKLARARGRGRRGAASTPPVEASALAALESSSS